VILGNFTGETDIIKLSIKRKRSDEGKKTIRYLAEKRRQSFFHSNFPKTIEAFVPPNPNELLMAYFIFFSLAFHGT